MLKQLLALLKPNLKKFLTTPFWTPFSKNQVPTLLKSQKILVLIVYFYKHYFESFQIFQIPFKNLRI